MSQNNIKYNIIYYSTFLIFTLGLIYFNSSNIELIDFIAIGNIFILSYSFVNKKPWAKGHEDELATLFAMMMITVIFRFKMMG